MALCNVSIRGSPVLPPTAGTPAGGTEREEECGTIDLPLLASFRVVVVVVVVAVVGLVVWW